MRKCLLFPDATERSRLAPFCPGQRGIVFMGLRDEDVPRFIVDAVMELKEKGIVGETAPAEADMPRCPLSSGTLGRGTKQPNGDEPGGLSDGIGIRSEKGALREPEAPFLSGPGQWPE